MEEIQPKEQKDPEIDNEKDQMINKISSPKNRALKGTTNII